MLKSIDRVAATREYLKAQVKQGFYYGEIPYSQYPSELPARVGTSFIWASLLLASQQVPIKHASSGSRQLVYVIVLPSRFAFFFFFFFFLRSAYTIHSF